MRFKVGKLQKLGGRVIFLGGLAALCQIRRKKNTSDEKENSLSSTTDERNAHRHNDDRSSKSSASIENGTACTTISSSLGSEQPEASSVVDPIPTAVSLVEIKMNLRHNNAVEKASSKRKTKSTRKKRRLIPVWGLHWECSSEGLKGKYTGSSFLCSTTGNQVAHGHGTLRFSNGDVYVGPFHYGEMHGSNATYYYHPSKSSRKKYCGSYVHNQKKHGSGIEIYNSARVAMDTPTDSDGDCSIDSSLDEDGGVSIYDDSKRCDSRKQESKQCDARKHKSLSMPQKATKHLTFSSLINEKHHLGVVPEDSEEHF